MQHKAVGTECGTAMVVGLSLTFNVFAVPLLGKLPRWRGGNIAQVALFGIVGGENQLVSITHFVPEHQHHIVGKSLSAHHKWCAALAQVDKRNAAEQLFHLLVGEPHLLALPCIGGKNFGVVLRADSHLAHIQPHGFEEWHFGKIHSLLWLLAHCITRL